MRKLARFSTVAAALAVAGCFTPADYGADVGEGGLDAHHEAEAEHEAVGEPIIEGIVAGSEPRKLDLDTPRIEFEAPFDGEPLSSTRLDSGVLVEDFELGEGSGAVEGQVLEFHFKGYSASANRQIMGSRVAPMRLLLNQASRDRDPMTNAMIDAVLGTKKGAKRRVKVPGSIVDKDLPPGRPPMGDLWITLEIVSVSDRPVLATADAYAGSASGKKRAGGVETFDYRAGEGREAKQGDRVVVHYIGMLDDGTVFDTSHERADGLAAILGAGGIIQGMATGLEGAKPGMLRKIVIPPEAGYGAQPNGPIPANSTLTFLIEVMAVEDAPPMPGPGMAPGPGGPRPAQPPPPAEPPPPAPEPSPGE